LLEAYSYPYSNPTFSEHIRQKEMINAGVSGAANWSVFFLSKDRDSLRNLVQKFISYSHYFNY
jgi:hypothetical protein